MHSKTGVFRKGGEEGRCGRGFSGCRVEITGNITLNPHPCPRAPHIPSRHHSPLPSARRCRAVCFVHPCTCLPSLMYICTVLCVANAALNKKMPAPPHQCEPQCNVLWLRARGALPVPGSDARRSSTTAGPRCRAPQFGLLLHRNAPALPACVRPPAQAWLAPASFADQLLALCSFIPVPGRPWLCILHKHIWTSPDHMTGTSATRKKRTQRPFCNCS